MAQPNLLELAKQGDTKIIETLFNRAVSSFNRAVSSVSITAKVTSDKGCLHILLEADKSFNKQNLVAFVRKKLIQWQVTSIQRVKVHGRKTGKKVADWTQEFDLREQVNNVTLPHVNPFSNDSCPPQNADSQESLEQLEALTGCDEHLQFAAEVIDSSDIPESLRLELRQQIDRIQQRRQEPQLYLAVVGEFSSGKSTLINALVRDDLLKTSALVATAAATQLRHGEDRIVEVSLKDPQLGTVKTKSNAKQIKIPWLTGVNGIDTRQFIHLVTSQDEVAKEVVSLTIHHPATFLANGIVIIDTPGTNATNPQHGAITRKVIESEADAAVIVIPATTPLSQTLVDFLAGSLRPFRSPS